MRALSRCCVTVALLLSVAWALRHDDQDHGGYTADQHHHGYNDKPDPTQAAVVELARHNADFAFALYRKLSGEAADGNKNVFFSPLGISMVLSTLALGAKGTTHAELYAALGYSNLTSDQVNEGYEHLLPRLHSNSSQEAMRLEVANALALSESFQPLDKFLDDAKWYYDSRAFTVNYSQPDVAKADINKYIANKTHNLITDMVKDLDAKVIMMLINCVYFKGKWNKPFSAGFTHKADFHVDANTKVAVDMMRRTGFYKLYYDQNNRTFVIMLPYKGKASMMIILPDRGKMAEVEGYISRDLIKHWHDSLHYRRVELSVPKFSTSATYSLDGTLKDLGVVTAYSDAADLSGISGEPNLKVSKVTHKAFLSVGEDGTEASAATIIELELRSGAPLINVNRPFLLLIVEDSTKSVLFMGKITDPTAKRVELSVPKFSTSATYSLDGTLKDLGVVTAYSDAADLSGISGEPNLKVSKVTHKAFLSVGEDGTEASAATIIELELRSGAPLINVNRPFLLLIVEDSTKSVLFMGKITDPTAK